MFMNGEKKMFKPQIAFDYYRPVSKLYESKRKDQSICTRILTAKVDGYCGKQREYEKTGNHSTSTFLRISQLSTCEANIGIG